MNFNFVDAVGIFLFIYLITFLFIPCFVIWFIALSLDRGNKESEEVFA